MLEHIQHHIYQQLKALDYETHKLVSHAAIRIRINHAAANYTLVLFDTSFITVVQRRISCRPMIVEPAVIDLADPNCFDKVLDKVNEINNSYNINQPQDQPTASLSDQIT